MFNLVTSFFTRKCKWNVLFVLVCWQHHYYCNVLYELCLEGLFTYQQSILPQHTLTYQRFIISLCTWGYNSLSDLTRQHKVWRKILLNTKSWYRREDFESMHTLLLPTKSAAARLFHWYQIKLMIWSARKQYYLDFWAFLELKLVNILIKTGLYFRQCWYHFYMLRLWN